TAASRSGRAAGAIRAASRTLAHMRAPNASVARLLGDDDREWVAPTTTASAEGETAQPRASLLNARHQQSRAAQETGATPATSFASVRSQHPMWASPIKSRTVARTVAHLGWPDPLGSVRPV